MTNKTKNQGKKKFFGIAYNASASQNYQKNMKNCQANNQTKCVLLPEEDTCNNF